LAVYSGRRRLRGLLIARHTLERAMICDGEQHRARLDFTRVTYEVPFPVRTAGDASRYQEAVNDELLHELAKNSS
jgi:hypothetical protein